MIPSPSAKSRRLHDMAGRRDLYLGKAGQAAVMSEFLVRGYNVAIPEVDIGHDLFVVYDYDTTDPSEASSFWKIQVKSASATKIRPRASFKVQVNIPWKQLKEPTKTRLFYIFCVRLEEQWSDYIIIERQDLNKLHELDKIGTIVKDKKTGEPKDLHLDIRFRENQIMCSKTSLQPYRNDWSHWPGVDHSLHGSHRPASLQHLTPVE